MKKYLLAPILAALVVGLTGCPEEDPQYPQGGQPYPQPYPQPGAYPQPYPQPGAYPQPYPQPAPYPAPAQTAQPTMIPGVMKLPDGTCQATPPSLDPNTPAQPITVICPPG
jgi:hypothetical protein